jgi:CBS domain-containing protein
MKVREIMTANVECVSPDAGISELAAKMKSLDVGFLPVCENDRLIGTVTDRDIVLRGLAEGRDLHSCKARDVMTSQIVYCFEEDDVDTVGARMQQGEVRRILILNQDKKLTGVVSIGDLSHARGKEKLVGKTTRDITRAAA